MSHSTHRLGGDCCQVGEMGARLVPVDFLQRQDVSVQRADSIGQPIKIDHPVVDGAAVQDVECRQPHGKKVPTIAEQLPLLPVTSDEPLLRTALKRSASALKADGVPFALGGGYGLWVAGGPEPSHDVDLVVAETDVEAAANSLAAAGLRIERPPEDWLFKAYRDEDESVEPAEEPPLVDVLHRLGGVPVTHSLLDTAREREVLGVRIPVLPPTPIMIAKLQSLSEHYCDFGALLPVVRAVREQLDWAEIRKATQHNPFAEAFLLLIERLGIIAPF
jgi:Nucleotidyl transferase of unknown function (DUF2204)